MAIVVYGGAQRFRFGQWASLRTGLRVFSTRPVILPALRFLSGTGSPCAFSAPVLESVTSLKSSVPASEQDTEKLTRLRRGRRCTAVPGVSLRLDHLQDRVRARVCVCTHVHTYACFCIHLYTSLKPVHTDTADPNPTPKLDASVLLSAFVMSISKREEAAPHYA